jgi:hypothetical protein
MHYESLFGEAFVCGHVPPPGESGASWLVPVRNLGRYVRRTPILLSCDSVSYLNIVKVSVQASVRESLDGHDCAQKAIRCA